ncbi:hypothetical protein V6N11_015482 [Hibiscus sabdariffa]|uniref:Uncharacterized protein n=1 Tax=Hibiscus sabdariffa TaxID=183260 RepID=A0ABR2TSH4_9ROSI
MPVLNLISSLQKELIFSLANYSPPSKAELKPRSFSYLYRRRSDGIHLPLVAFSRPATPVRVFQPSKLLSAAVFSTVLAAARRRLPLLTTNEPVKE